MLVPIGYQALEYALSGYELPECHAKTASLPHLVLGDFSFSFCSELTYLAPIPDCRVIGADILHDKNRVLDPGRITHSKRRS